MKSEYDFTFAVKGYYTVYVKANDYDEAEKMALDAITDVDFGYLEDIDSEIID